MNNNISVLKKKIAKFSLDNNPFIDDLIIKGGYRVVRTTKERDSIDCCHRKLGMKVMVMGQDYSYKEYTLKGEDICSNDDWIIDTNPSGEIGTINDSDVTLLDDYSGLDVTQNIQTQQDLNIVLSKILKSLLLSNTIGDKTYIHDQFAPANFWYINHNLGKNPSIQVFDTLNREVKTTIQHIDLNNSVSESNIPFNGKATCN